MLPFCILGRADGPDVSSCVRTRVVGHRVLLRGGVCPSDVVLTIGVRRRSPVGRGCGNRSSRARSVLVRTRDQLVASSQIDEERSSVRHRMSYGVLLMPDPRPSNTARIVSRKLSLVAADAHGQWLSKRYIAHSLRMARHGSSWAELTSSQIASIPASSLSIVW